MGDSAADATAAAPKDGASTKVEVMMCQFCGDALTPETVAFRCNVRKIDVYCKECIRKWFLLATKSEQHMPVCCCALSSCKDMALSDAGNLLTDDEVRTPFQPFNTFLAC